MFSGRGSSKYFRYTRYVNNKIRFIPFYSFTQTTSKVILWIIIQLTLCFRDVGFTMFNISWAVWAKNRIVKKQINISLFPELKPSSQGKLYPNLSIASHRLEPMKSAPPVTRNKASYGNYKSIYHSRYYYI